MPTPEPIAPPQSPTPEGAGHPPVLPYASAADDDAPTAEKLRAEMQRVFGPDVPWTDEREVAMRVALTTQVLRIRRRRLASRVATGAVAAVVAFLAVGILIPAVSPAGRSIHAARPALVSAPGGAAGLAATLAPASNAPQMLDAYRVARTLARGGVPDARWDRDGNGRVDRADVDLIALASVQLAKGGTP